MHSHTWLDRHFKLVLSASIVVSLGIYAILLVM